MSRSEVETSATDGAAGFPVTWGDPKNAERSWFFDIGHTPDVLSPLGYDLFYGPFIAGFGWLRVCYQNYYVYMSMLLDIKPPPAAQIVAADLHARIDGWEQQGIPEAIGQATYYRETDFDSMGDAELERELRTLYERRGRQGQLHSMALGPFFVATHLLTETYKELSGGDELGAMRLVQGHGNKSVDAGERLWEIARLVDSTADVRERLLSVDRASARDRLAELRELPAAGPFLEAFSAFLEEFGWRSDLFEMATPAWFEDPTIPLCQLRAYLELPDYDPAVERRKLAEEREAAIGEAMASVSDEAARQRLAEVIDVVRRAVRIQEDHNYYIDQRCGMIPRRLVLAAGRRLVARKALAAADDVFYLRDAELRAALEGTLDDPAAAVRRHKQEMARWANVTPPANIGAPPAEGAPGWEPKPSFDGARPNELPGNGASAGVARGPARVLMSLTEADRLKPGDILVARTTMPAWTPLFAVASAVITETGGMLSHAAVVAREYGIPAVLGVTEATRRINDGQLLEVDGTQGVVRLLS